MQFFRSSDSRNPAPIEESYPCIVYVKEGWDDFGYETLHRLYYCKAPQQYVALGKAKFLRGDTKITELPVKFSKLTPDFVSLGQDLDYYITLKATLSEDADKILKALNDIALNQQLLVAAELLEGFSASLTRFNDGKIALRDGRGIILEQELLRKYNFKYLGEIPGAEFRVPISFDLNKKDHVPGRLMSMIGRNGVGKTQLLASLARDLSASYGSGGAPEATFPAGRPLFSRIIALSFSAFDDFARPIHEDYFSYIYCGIRDKEGALSKEALASEQLKYLTRIKDLNREYVWGQAVAKAWNARLRNVDIQSFIDVLEVDQSPSMSSGQYILTYFISAAVAYLKPDSLILFDEPEVHLHPNAVAMLMTILQDLLEEYDSYALLATHSPLVIQEVPSKRVIRLERTQNITSAHTLDKESFGEDVSALTGLVFETVEIPNFYQKIFGELSKQFSFDEISALFGNKLSLHASTYLASLYRNKNV